MQDNEPNLQYNNNKPNSFKKPTSSNSSNSLITATTALVIKEASVAAVRITQQDRSFFRQQKMSQSHSG